MGVGMVTSNLANSPGPQADKDNREGHRLGKWFCNIHVYCAVSVERLPYTVVTLDTLRKEVIQGVQRGSESYQRNSKSS